MKGTIWPNFALTCWTNMNATNTLARVTGHYRGETFRAKKLRFPYIGPKMVYFLSYMYSISEVCVYQ